MLRTLPLVGLFLIFGCSHVEAEPAPAAPSPPQRPHIVLEWPDGHTTELADESEAVRPTLEKCGVTEDATIRIRVDGGGKSGKRLELVRPTEEARCIFSALVPALPDSGESAGPPPSNFTGQLRVEW